MGLHQTKKFLKVKETNKIKRKPTVQANIFTDTPDKGLISKLYNKVLTKLNTKKTNNPIKKWQGPTQMFLQRGCIDGQLTYKKMLNVTNNQRDAN